MPALLAPLVIWIIGSAVAKIFVAIGIGFFTYTGVEYALEQALSYFSQYIGQLPTSSLSIIALAGVPQAASVIGSALLTRAAFNAAKVSVGLSV